MDTRTYNVEGMTCQHCVDSVTKEVSGVSGVNDVKVDLTDGTVTVQGDGIDDAAVRAAVDEAGYAVVG